MSSAFAVPIKETLIRPSRSRCRAECWNRSTIRTNFWALRISILPPMVCTSAPSGASSTSIAPPMVEICAGDDAQYTVTVGVVGGFSNDVTLAASGQPAGATTGFSVNPVTPPGSSLLTVGNTGGAAGGGYTVTISGTAAGSDGHEDGGHIGPGFDRRSHVRK